MKPLPWTSLSEVEGDREYVFLATQFHVKSVFTTVRFLRMAGRVTEQLQAGPTGLVGFALWAKLLSGRFWTLSVWEDGRALGSFIRTRPHLTAMEELAPKMRVFRSARWNASGRTRPPSWQEALERLAEQTPASEPPAASGRQ
jgi:hypothetical protein